MSCYIFYIVQSLHLYYILIQGNVIGSTSSFPFQDVSRNFSQHSQLRLVYFTIFLSYDILSTKILYQAAVDIKSCVYNAVCIFLQTLVLKTKQVPFSKSREKHLTIRLMFPPTLFFVL